MKNLKYYFVTGNEGKVKELMSKCSLLGANIMIERIKLDLDEYQGDADFVTTKKLQDALHIVTSQNLIKDEEFYLMIEDTSLYFNALGHLPGPYIKDFYALGLDKLVKVLDAFEDKSAVAQCSIGLISNTDKKAVLIKGQCEGEIKKASGEGGFGWDPVFYPKGMEVSYAHLSTEEKNKISHRGKAIEKFVQFVNADGKKDISEL